MVKYPGYFVFAFVLEVKKKKLLFFFSFFFSFNLSFLGIRKCDRERLLLVEYNAIY